MAIPITFHTFSHCKSWPSYHLAYFTWMKSVSHPTLATSNYYADTYKIRNAKTTIPVLSDQESKSRWPP